MNQIFANINNIIKTIKTIEYKQFYKLIKKSLLVFSIMCILGYIIFIIDCILFAMFNIIKNFIKI